MHQRELAQKVLDMVLEQQKLLMNLKSYRVPTLCDDNKELVKEIEEIRKMALEKLEQREDNESENENLKLLDEEQEIELLKMQLNEHQQQIQLLENDNQELQMQLRNAQMRIAQEQISAIEESYEDDYNMQNTIEKNEIIQKLQDELEEKDEIIRKLQAQ